MIKILGICGSPRRKSAYTALKTALEAVEKSGEEVQTELVELRGKKMNLCIHCNPVSYTHLTLPTKLEV